VPTDDQDAEQQELSLIAGGNVKYIVFLEDRLLVSYKTKASISM
jgi:hypothetical protein